MTQIGERKSTASVPYLEFGSNLERVSGDGGCNRFSGTVTVSGQSLKFSRVISTQRACADDAANRNEAEFLQILDKVTRFDQKGGTLSLFAGDTPAIVLTAR